MNRRLIDKADALLKKERGAFFKDPGGKISVCLVYPNTYHVGMSNLGFQGIYALLNRRDDVVCERAFLPDPADVGEYARTSTTIFSLESKKPLSGFDIVAFSVSFENDYPNIGSILGMSKIPFRASARNEYHPLLIAGGVCASFNPEPLAPAFDIFFVGEAEEAVGEFMDGYNKSAARSEVLEFAASINGVYVPSMYEVIYGGDGTISRRVPKNGAPGIIKKRIISDISLNPLNTSILTSETEFSGMCLVELMRGCPWSCRFCLAGNFFGPPRSKEIARVKEEIAACRKQSGRIGIIGPSLSDYQSIEEVLCIEGVKFSITSLRAGSSSSRLIRHLGGHKSVSIAPEAGTERLRRVINKRVTEGDVLDTARMLFDAGVETLRLYFMIGLPTETGEDIDGIIRLAGKVRSIDKTRNLVLSVSTFVPKPFTPFQWCAMEKIDPIKQKLKKLKQALGGEGIKIFHDVPRHAHMQGLFSLGDRRVFPVIEGMADAADYHKSCAAAGVDPDYYIFRQKKYDETFPWDFIGAGITKEKLWNEYCSALSN
jgi:radical SAM superfamily enzyme YgiQ (UPF0313 family)